MVRHVGSSAGSYLADPTSPIPSHCSSIATTSTIRVDTIPSLLYCRRSPSPCLPQLTTALTHIYTPRREVSLLPRMSPLMYYIVCHGTDR